MSEHAIRLLEERYFHWEKPNQVNQRRCSLRYFSEFLGYPRTEWQKAFGSILRLDEAEGNARLDSFRRWLLERQQRAGGAHEIFYHVRPFLSFANREGVLHWRVRRHHEEFVEKQWGACTPAFRDALKSWLDNLRVRNFSKHTIRGYRVHLIGLGRFLAQQKVNGLAMRPRNADEWVTEIRDRHAAESTARSYVRAAYSFFKWLVATHRTKCNPFEGYPRFRIIKRVPRHVPERQIFRLLRAKHPPREKALLEVLYASGCRLGELASLNLASVSFKDRTARCLGKGAKERLLLFNRAAVRAIKAYLPLRERMLRHPGCESQPALFVSCVGRRLSVARLCSLVNEAVTRAKLRVSVTAHVIRHSVATHLLNRGADLETIQKLLGHTDLRSTVIYAHLLQPRMRRNYLKAVPRIGGTMRDV